MDYKIKSNNMKERILKGWNFQRILFIVIGSLVIIQSVKEPQWFGIVIGGYFTAMGLFAFGCAGGNCVYEPRQKRKE
ncbi:MAG TPA: hypothetical protein DIT07_13645 [Sphingobacteriaceae bacterium]|nr:hypothetical protein [Sphingobacteriaceae bacterium]